MNPVPISRGARFFVAWILALSVLSALRGQSRPSSAPSTVATGRLVVASYNVENLFDNYDNPYKPDEGTPPKSSADTHVLARTIDALRADVLALEEVENLGVVERLNSLLAHPFPFVEILPANDMRGIHCALLSRVRIVRSFGHRFWNVAPGQRFARDLPFYELEPSPGRTVLVAPVHLKSKRTYGKDKNGKAWRTAEAKAVLAILTDLRKHGVRAPAIVLGDMNDLRDSEALAPVLTKLQDATLLVPDGERWSFTWSGHRQQIDYVLYDAPGAAWFRPVAAKFVHEEDAASDHAPVVVEFAWPVPVVRVSSERAARRTEAAAKRPPRLSATDVTALRRNLLREVIAFGTVARVRQTNRGGHYNVTFAKDARKALTAFIPREAVSRFGDIEALVGKEISVRGPLFLYHGRLEIQLTRAEQLER